MSEKMIKEERTLLEKQKTTLRRDISGWGWILIVFVVLVFLIFYFMSRIESEPMSIWECLCIVLECTPYILIALVIYGVGYCITHITLIKLRNRFCSLITEETEEISIHCSEVKILVDSWWTHRTQIIGVKLKNALGQEYIFVLYDSNWFDLKTKKWLKEKFTKKLTLRCYKGTNFVREHDAYTEEELQRFIDSRGVEFF